MAPGSTLIHIPPAPQKNPPVAMETPAAGSTGAKEHVASANSCRRLLLPRCDMMKGCKGSCGSPRLRAERNGRKWASTFDLE